MENFSSGNFSNRPSQSLMWLDQSKIEEGGQKLRDSSDPRKMQSIMFEGKTDIEDSERNWQNYRQYDTLIQHKIKMGGLIPRSQGEATYSDMSKLRRDNQNLRKRLELERMAVQESAVGRYENEQRMRAARNETIRLKREARRIRAQNELNMRNEARQKAKELQENRYNSLTDFLKYMEHK